MSKISADSISSRSGGNITVNNDVNVVGVITATTLSSSGANITGVVTATSFVGSGSGLTGVSAGINTSKSVGMLMVFGY